MKMINKNLKKWPVLIFILALLVVWSGSGCKQKSIARLLEEGKYKAAEKRCAKAKPEVKAGCFKTIAAFYLNKEQYGKAADLYARAGEPMNVINCYFQGDLIREAEEYCAGQTGEAKKQCTLRLAQKFFLNGNAQKAVRYYKAAGEIKKVLYIESRVPILQLTRELGRRAKEVKDPGMNETIRGIKSTLTAYIYMDKYREWPYERKSEPGKRAAGICETALKMLEDRVVPTLVEKLTASFVDSQKSIEAVSFDQVKTESLIDLIKSLYHIAGNREFFTGRLNYEEAYGKALDHAETLLETMEESDKTKNKERLRDYKEDMAVDMKVVDYISAMMDNMKIRMEDILRRSEKLKEESGDETMKETSERLSRDFAAVCSRVLHDIGKGEYEEANKLLVSGYNTAKTRIDQYSGQK